MSNRTVRIIAVVGMLIVAVVLAMALHARGVAADREMHRAANAGWLSVVEPIAAELAGIYDGYLQSDDRTMTVDRDGQLVSAQFDFDGWIVRQGKLRLLPEGFVDRWSDGKYDNVYTRSNAFQSLIRYQNKWAGDHIPLSSRRLREAIDFGELTRIREEWRPFAEGFLYCLASDLHFRVPDDEITEGRLLIVRKLGFVDDLMTHPELHEAMNILGADDPTDAEKQRLKELLSRE